MLAGDSDLPQVSLICSRRGVKICLYSVSPSFMAPLGGEPEVGDSRSFNILTIILGHVRHWRNRAGRYQNIMVKEH